jgi:hypothetical protein
MRAAIRVWAVAAALVPLAWTSAPAAPQLSIRIIVHKDNPAAALTVPELQRMYRKQTRMWPHGESVVPVDWDSTSPVREEFSERVMRHSIREMADFWLQQNITQGLTPPTTLRSTRAILRFVASVPGAIAYVPADEVDDTVKRLDLKGLQ